MNKTELIAECAKETGLTQTVVGKVINQAVEVVLDVLYTDEPVEIRGFGKLELVNKAPRRRYDMNKRRCVEQRAKVKVRFKPYAELRHCLALLTDEL